MSSVTHHSPEQVGVQRQNIAGLRFDPSAITSRINMMGAAVVSRASLSRRLSSNNSPADTPMEDQSSRGGTDQDRKSFISAASSSVFFWILIETLWE